LFAFVATAFAQESNFAGAQLGVSTLSADGRGIISTGSTAVSLYKPENSLTGQIFAGRHLTDYLSFQGSYGWNGNDVRLTSVQVSGSTERSYEQERSARHHTFVGELLVYFRPRASSIRPYLSAGLGVARFSSREEQTVISTGGPALPPREFRSADACFRVAVGIDVKLGRGPAFRYTFAETIQGNPISSRLTPPGQRNLANFQNLFGFAWRF
jgi:Outer membrane protein beta-barrel domain